MKKIIGILLTFVLFSNLPLMAATQAVQGFCSVGGERVAISGLNSSTLVQASYPSCLVAVYLTGTTTLATIYSDNNSTPLSNPFTANTNASWLFYATLGEGVDVKMSGGTPNSFPNPFTLVDIVPGSGGGGGGSPAPPSFAVQIANAGATEFDADPNININTTSHTLTAEVLNGKKNSDSFATGSGNNGITNAFAGCTTSNCLIERPPTSTDTEMSQPLPVTSTTNSSLVVDNQGNSLAVSSTNPQPANNLANIGTNNPPGVLTNQSLHSDFVVFSQRNPGTVQGATQFRDNYFATYSGPGYTLGGAGCPDNCPQAGYSSAGDWSVTVDDSRTGTFNTAGIRQMHNEAFGCFGVGDCSHNYLYESYAGGYITPSDEGFYADKALHATTPGDFVGTLATITDPYHLFITPTAGAQTQGDGRYIMDSSAPVFSNASVSLVTAPTSTTPGTVTLPNVTLPVDNAIGTLATACIVPIQDSGMATTSCVVNVTSGAFNTTQPICMAQSVGNYMNFGGQVLSATTLTGGQQTLSVTIRKTVDPANGGTVYVRQGQLCGTGIDLTSDIGAVGNGGSVVHGSFFPLIGAISAHVAEYAYYNSSQTWMPIPGFTSNFRTTGMAGSTLSGGSYALTSLVRNASNVVTATAPANNDYNVDILNNQKFFTISGCTDTTFNVVGNSNASSIVLNYSGGAESGATVTYTQSTSPNTASTCANAVLTLNNSLVNINYAAEITDVSDPTLGVASYNAVDGYMAHTYQPNFVVGNTMDSPPNYAATYTGEYMNLELGQPYTGGAKGYVVQFGNTSSFAASAYSANSGILGTNSTYSTVGSGGVNLPPDFAGISGLFSNFLNADTAPPHNGAVIRIGFPSNLYPSSFSNYDMWNIDNSVVTEHYDSPTNTITDRMGTGGATFIRSPTATIAQGVPMVMQNAQFEAGSVNGYIPVTQMRDCGVQGLLGEPCYDNVYNTAPTITSATPGSSTLAYTIAINNLNGTVSFTPFALSYSSTTPVVISCSVVPSGQTGTVYTYFNPNFELVGTTTSQCTGPSATVTDSGTYGPPLGNTGLSDGGNFNSGSITVNGNGSIAFTTKDIFGNDLSLSPVAQVSMPTTGTFSFDTTTKGNGLGTIIAAGATFSLKASFTTTAVTSESVTITGMTSSGHCSMAATNAVAGTMIQNATPVYISGKTTNAITLNHVATAGASFDFVCTPN